VIIGGGLSGLAAASCLVEHDLEVVLLESRPRLGGRAGSFTDPSTGELVDNCQHVSMACCTNLADFCDRVGTRHLFRVVREIVFLSREGKTSKLAASSLPAPFHLAGSFLRANYLSFSDKIRVGYALARLRFDRAGRPGESFAAWLTRHHQTPQTIERYWGTVLISALNELPEQMDVSHARKVFFDGFLRNREGFAMEVPLVPLGDLYGKRLESWLASQAVSVRLTTGVKSVEVDEEGSVAAVVLRSGERIEADFVVLSVPFDRVRSFFDDDALARLPSLKLISEMKSSPITGVHLWFDR
jgi:squalene-associated FAD-dependent desaturase